MAAHVTTRGSLIRLRFLVLLLPLFWTAVARRPRSPHRREQGPTGSDHDDRLSMVPPDSYPEPPPLILDDHESPPEEGGHPPLLGWNPPYRGHGNRRKRHEDQPPTESPPSEARRRRKVPTPLECSWFTAALRRCRRSRLSSERYRYLLRRLQNTSYRQDLLVCLAIKSAELPDNMYCTDKESVNAMNTCIKENVNKRMKASREELQELTDEIKSCLGDIHRTKISRIKREGKRHRRRYI